MQHLLIIQKRGRVSRGTPFYYITVQSTRRLASRGILLSRQRKPNLDPLQPPGKSLSGGTGYLRISGSTLSKT